MSRGFLFAGMLLAAGVACAQDVVISGKDFLSGAGDAKIAELARQAAAAGKTLVISAPPYWQDKAAAKAHAGAANAAVRTSDAFFENVTVRLEDAKGRSAEAPKPPPRAEPRSEPKVAARPEPKPAPPRAAVVEQAPAPKPAPVAPPPAPKPMPVAEPPPATAAAPAPAPAKQPAARPAPPPPAAMPAPKPAVAATPAPPPAAAATPPKAQAPAPDPAIAIRKRMEQNLNNGDAAEGSIEVGQLQKNDMLFVDGPVRGVVRRFGPRTHLYWLQGDLNLERAELVPTGNDRYRVEEKIRNVANPSLRGTSRGKALMFTGNVPAPGSKARREIEGRYNDGRTIDATLQPTELHQGDLVYTNQGSAVVIRRTSVGIERYWLVGQMDLHQTGLQSQGNAIRVLTDTVR